MLRRCFLTLRWAAPRTPLRPAQTRPASRAPRAEVATLPLALPILCDRHTAHATAIRLTPPQRHFERMDKFQQQSRMLSYMAQQMSMFTEEPSKPRPTLPADAAEQAT